MKRSRYVSRRGGALSPELELEAAGREGVNPLSHTQSIGTGRFSLQNRWVGSDAEKRQVLSPRSPVKS